jgi:hypothetical protein
MSDHIDRLLERAFAQAARSAADEDLVQTILNRIDRRARLRALALGGAGFTAALVAAIVALPAMDRLEDVITGFTGSVQIAAPILVACALAAVSPWLVAMVDDRV